jgi:hypothetical protein
MTTFVRGIIGVVFLAVLLVCSATAVHAQTTLCYTGNDFTATTSPYTTSDSVSGCVTLNVPLASNTSADYSGDVTSYSFSDGVQDFTNLNSTLSLLDFTTSPSDSITAWALGITSGPGSIISINAPSAFTFDEGTNATGAGANFFNPGVWTNVSATPEPSSLILLLSGILLAGIKLLKSR